MLIETKKLEQKLEDFAPKTVSPTYHKTCCTTGDWLNKWYQELRRSGMVYNKRIRLEARDEDHKLPSKFDARPRWLTPAGRPSGIKKGTYTATYGHTCVGYDHTADAEREADTIKVLGDASTWKANATAQGTREMHGRGQRGRGGRSTSSRRKRAETMTNSDLDSPICRGCLSIHDWTDCWYLFPGQRAQGWESS
ncbi:uncharacterized protein NECHADRAFT_88483 [Fusarium vanettenii 77-13-4]|uniref:Uncharacterized protein n=1 Tax=Fusarium vanettenii (strain ATCC MYA-4622 / CBS 123669 / FGSC 9596 / NRRL 45880 / 77-13-4) TaxID=660122 RepID=C7ZBP5_FUSV7|nr:uncharacterized protein NECHADRAFT_88483 [Fusarium vanettenii 77-13-4]EEU38551.1 predicted protein [Fusarium vanettenii 77-13-4]